LKIFDTLEEMRVALGEDHVVYKTVKEQVTLIYDAGDIETSFMGMFGGNCYLIEAPEDTLKLPGLALDAGGNYLSCALKPSAIDTVSRHGDYIMFLLCTNNAGGDFFYVPQSIHNNNANLLATEALTIAYWARNEQELTCK